MKRNGFPRSKTNTILGSLVVLSLFLCSSVSYAQSPADFSGLWLMDNSKSDAEFKDYEITLSVKQDLQTITIQRTFVTKGEKTTATPLTFNLDEKVVSKEEYGGINKTSSRWSSDKKVLTLTTIRTVNGTDYGSEEVYKLSTDGKVLTVQINSIAPPGGPRILEVFNKK
jgi:hypothetical protein